MRALKKFSSNAQTKPRLISGFVILLVGAIATTAFVSHRQDQAHPVAARQIGDASRKAGEANWESSFFTALEERTRVINLPSLRSGVRDPNDLEFRLWYDARPDVINGVVIRRANDRWSAVGIHQLRNRWPSKVRQEVLKPPRSGWDNLWKQLLDAGLLGLPDSDQIKCSYSVLDGVGLVLETISKQKYRTYRYSNPQLAPCAEAKQVVKIEGILADEFTNK